MENIEVDESTAKAIAYHITESDRPNRWFKRMLNAGDSFLSIFIVTPLVVTHWRGTWVFMDNHAEYFHPWNCFILGMVVHVTFTLLRELLIEYISKNKKHNKTVKEKVFVYLVSRIYCYLFSISCNMQWRGGWGIMELYLGPDYTPALWVSLGCLIGLIIFCSVRNLIAPPYVLVIDRKSVSFMYPTRFRVERTREPLLYILDCLFSVIFIGSLVVFVWRGAWVLLDLTLFTEDKGLSAFGSLIIGYGVVGITFALQPVMRWTCDRLEGIWRIAVADVFLFISFIGTINVWRGVWQLLDVYFIPENKLLSDLITHFVSIILLALLNCSNSVLVRGVYIDAEEPAGQCVVFPVYYIRLFFQKERTKKQKRLLLEAMDSGQQAEQHNSLLLEKRPANHIIIVKNNTHHIKSEKNQSGPD